MRMLFLILIVSCSPLSALDALREIGAGTQSKGMGGVGIAFPQDALASAHNPAGMSFVCRRFDIGGDWIWLAGQLSVRDAVPPEANGTYNSHTNFGFPEVGASWVIRPGMTIGVAGYLFGTFDVRYRRAIPTFGTTPLSSRYRQYFITPSWSLLLHPCHSIGVGLNIAVAVARFNGLENLIPLSEYPTRVTNMGNGTSAGASLRLGWIGHFCQTISLGLIYQTRTWMIRLRKYKGLVPEEGNSELPSLVGVGLATIFTPEFTAALDVEWVFWSDAEGFGNRTDSTNPLGSKSGPGLGWDDAITVKLGFAYQLYTCLTLRVGYNYGRSPLNTDNLQAGALTLLTPQQHLTAGATYCRCGHSVSLALVRGFSRNVTGPVYKVKGSTSQVSLSYGRFF